MPKGKLEVLGNIWGSFIEFMSKLSIKPKTGVGVEKLE